MATLPADIRYGDERRSWKEEFVGYMRKLVEHPNFSGMPDAIDDQGQIRWNAPSNRPPGRWQDLRDRRLVWWQGKAEEIGIETRGEWISKVAKAIHPFKEKPCQTCGRVMSLDYVYPTKNTLQKLNRALPESEQFIYEDFLTVYEIVPALVKKMGPEAYQALISIFPALVNIQKTEEAFIRSFSEDIVPLSPRGKLSPGAMSNAPDRLDGFHTYNLCCRNKQDTGRTAENLRTYSDDRRAFEYWCEGDWAAANLLMTLAGIGPCPECERVDQMSADHIGPISLGFAHTPWFKPLCSSCNSSKGNRLSHADVLALIAREETGSHVASFQVKALWDALKHKVSNDSEATKLSKLLRINQHYFLLLLSEIYDSGHPEMLLTLLSPELAEEKIEFVDLNPLDFSFKEIRRSKRGDTYSRSKAARMIRIAFDSLDDYASKEKRNIQAVPGEVETSLREAVTEALKTEASTEGQSDTELRRELFRALRSDLGPEERAALIEKLFNGKYKAEEDFAETREALRLYAEGVGAKLAKGF
jgi:Alw26I/Eco31I/Esp3I family type II restriction endonuclease